MSVVGSKIAELAAPAHVNIVMKPHINRIHKAALQVRAVPLPVRYVATVLLVGLVGSASLHIAGEGQRNPFLAFFPVIFLCGLFFDRGNGFLATILSTLFCAYFFLTPLGSFGVTNGYDQAALALFFGIGLLISSLVELLHTGLVELSAEHARAQGAVIDRDVLLRELGHRTRNDLSNVVTLLNLQSREATPEAREMLAAAANRVQAIARVHRQLELRGTHVVVDSKAYITELCADLRLSRLAVRPIAIECNAESHSLGIEKAIPLGLIVNESVTNAVKHAFRDDRPGIISVSFRRTGDVYRLAIIDNGTGVKASNDEKKPGMGSRLMQLLAGQLGTILDTTTGPDGTAVVVDIAVKSATKSEN